MSLVFNEKYPNKTAGATQNYPYGEARNVSGPGNGDGTPWDAALVNDIFGLLQGLLLRAKITPNGQSDTALNSQYLKALETLFNPSITAVLEDPGRISIPVFFGGVLRNLEIKFGRTPRDYTKINHKVTFAQSFENTCAFVFTQEEQENTSFRGDGAFTVYERNKEGFSAFVQVYNDDSGVSQLISFSWVAIGW